MEPIEVFLVEDHTVVREGLRKILEQQPDLRVVGEAHRGDDALEAIARLRPHVALLDLRLPGLSGVELAARVGATWPKIKVVILSAYDDVDYVVAAFQAGVAGYLLKTVHSGDLVAAVRAVHAGETVLQPAVAQKLAQYWQRRGAGDADVRLTPRELEVLRLLARGLPNKMIARQLGVRLHTVEGHLVNLFAKIGVTSRTEAALYAVHHRLLSLVEGDAP
jgi:DNA-binding NarL/FixJ family response regulator